MAFKLDDFYLPILQQIYETFGISPRINARHCFNDEQINQKIEFTNLKVATLSEISVI